MKANIPFLLIAIMMATTAGCAHQTPLKLFATEDGTKKTYLLMNINSDGTLAPVAFGKYITSLENDQVKAGDGTILMTLARDNRIQTAENLEWRVDENGEIHFGKNARVNINDKGEVIETPKESDGFTYRFTGFSPKRRRQAALAYLGMIYHRRGCIAQWIAEGMSQAYGRAANPEGRIIPKTTDHRPRICPSLEEIHDHPDHPHPQ